VSRLGEGRTILVILLLGLALYFTVAAFGYGPRSRLFPIAIGIPTVFLTALALAALWKPGLIRKADVDFGTPSSDALAAGSEEPEAAGDPPLGVLRMLGWLLLAVAGIAVFGFSVTVPVYILLFARIEGRARWSAAIPIAILTWAFIFGYFDLFMKFRMFRGVLFGDSLPVL